MAITPAYDQYHIFVKPDVNAATLAEVNAALPSLTNKFVHVLENNIIYKVVKERGVNKLQPLFGSQYVFSEASGGSDGDAETYTHIQASPLETWNVNHNLGFKPDVYLLDDSGQEYEAQVLHLNTNQVQILHNEPTAGTARCT